ncbi:hypothetical protein EDF28_1173 [Curtobacterium sp. PhB137]|uniref:hypothetical protein n=1 Tax=Curtobacterium sp. PhB137 TaxID=2485182 RepID=UPI000F51261C|nr:hypothetical protein [Curtobacterium sp. PhB137]RPE85228.1 hypothetical protein EDF28_1173 [Curtobacterium sp. PhB137]
MGWGRIVPVVVVAVLASGVLAGCGADGRIQGIGPGTSVSSCIDYVPLTAAERRDAADLVVDARVTRTDRTVELGGVYDVHDAEVTKVAKGDAPGTTIEVVSTSDKCTTSGEPVEYLDGDVLADEGRFRLYLTKADPDDDDSVWQLVVPGAADPLATG